MVEISQPYVCNRLILIPSNRKLRHMYSCVSLILEISQTQIYRYTGHAARMGENCIPNWILHGEIKAGCHKQGILTQENFQRRAQEQPAHTCVINWSLQLGKIWSTRKHKYFRKTGKNKVKRVIQEKKKQNLLKNIYMWKPLN